MLPSHTKLLWGSAFRERGTQAGSPFPSVPFLGNGSLFKICCNEFLNTVEHLQTLLLPSHTKLPWVPRSQERSRERGTLIKYRILRSWERGTDTPSHGTCSLRQKFKSNQFFSIFFTIFFSVFFFRTMKYESDSNGDTDSTRGQLHDALKKETYLLI